MALNLGKSVVDFLTGHPDEKFTARQIAEWIFATFPDECHAKKASSQALETDSDLLQQLVAEIGSQRPRLQKEHANLKTTEGRPRKYYVSEKSDIAEVAAAENVGVEAPVGKDEAKLGEHGLYPLLSSYLWAEFGVYSKRIDESARRTNAGPTAIAGSIRIWSAWRTWAPTGTKRSRTASISIQTSALSCGRSRSSC